MEIDFDRVLLLLNVIKETSEHQKFPGIKAVASAELNDIEYEAREAANTERERVNDLNTVPKAPRVPIQPADVNNEESVKARRV